jgi:hypothetical protein
VKRCIADRDGGHAVDLDQAPLNQIEGEHIRHEVDGSRRVAKLTHHLANARYIAEGQGDVNGGHAVRARKGRDVLAMTYQVRRVDGVREPVRAAKIKEPEESLAGQAAQQLEADAVRADDQVGRCQVAVRDEPLGAQPGDVHGIDGQWRHGEPCQHHGPRELRGDLESEARQQQHADDGSPLDDDLQEHRCRCLAAELLVPVRASEDATCNDKGQQCDRAERGSERHAKAQGADRHGDDSRQRLELLEYGQERRFHAAQPDASLCVRARD